MAGKRSHVKLCNPGIKLQKGREKKAPFGSGEATPTRAQLVDPLFGGGSKRAAKAVGRAGGTISDPPGGGGSALSQPLETLRFHTLESEHSQSSPFCSFTNLPAECLNYGRVALGGSQKNVKRKKGHLPSSKWNKPCHRLRTSPPPSGANHVTIFAGGGQDGEKRGIPGFSRGVWG